jgi:hypothetical protein
VLNYAVGGARACDYRPVPGATPTPAIGPGKVSPPLRGVEILNLTQQVSQKPFNRGIILGNRSEVV